MKFAKMVAVCAVLALGVGVSSAAAKPHFDWGKFKGHHEGHHDDLRYDRVVGSCDDGMPGTVTVAGGAARLFAPMQMSWAQIRAYPHHKKISKLWRLSFRSNASDPGVVYMKITLEGGHSV